MEEGADDNAEEEELGSGGRSGGVRGEEKEEGERNDVEGAEVDGSLEDAMVR